MISHQKLNTAALLLPNSPSTGPGNQRHSHQQRQHCYFSDPLMFYICITELDCKIFATQNMSSMLLQMLHFHWSIKVHPGKLSEKKWKAKTKLLLCTHSVLQFITHLWRTGIHYSGCFAQHKTPNHVGSLTSWCLWLLLSGLAVIQAMLIATLDAADLWTYRQEVLWSAQKSMRRREEAAVLIIVSREAGQRMYVVDRVLVHIYICSQTLLERK